MIKLSSSQFISIGVTVIISIIICSSGAAATDYQNATQISEGEYSDSIIGVDHDIYEINLESGDTIDVQLNYSDSASNPVDFTIRDSEADRVSTDVQQDTPTTDTVTKQAATQVESAGTYYIHVDEDQGRYTTHESTTDYTLSVDLSQDDGENEESEETTDDSEDTADDGAVADTGEEEVAEDGAVDDMGEEEEENIDGSEEQDSDGDGVPDSEDYAPRDPEIQDEGDTRQPPEQETTGDGGAVESADSSPGLGIVSSLAGLGGASYLLKRRMDKQDSE